MCRYFENHMEFNNEGTHLELRKATCPECVATMPLIFSSCFYLVFDNESPPKDEKVLRKLWEKKCVHTVFKWKRTHY